MQHQDLSLAALTKIDAICDAFEAGCLAGEKPEIVEHLQSQDSPAFQRQLLKSLLLVRLDYDPQIDQNAIADEFSEYSDVVEEVFAAIQAPKDETLPGKVPEAPAMLPDEIGRFRVHEMLGKGGFGAVYGVYDPQLERMIALKKLHAYSLNDIQRARFQREARNTARLIHPAIAQIYEVGEIDDEPYIAMELVQGETLSKHLTTEQIDLRLAADLMGKVAAAISYAHEQGIVHRDIKPSNIILSESTANDADAGFHPKIIDFGLAIEHEMDHTISTDGIVGTPAYMSPEQAAGHSANADERSDIYSIGAVLYELICGETPFQGSTATLVSKIASSDVPALAARIDTAPNGLTAICHKCLNLEPERRYQSANALRDDLSNWLHDRPIQARHTTRIEKCVLWAKRNRRLAATAAIAISTLLIIATAFALSVAKSNRVQESAADALVKRLLDSDSDKIPPLVDQIRANPFGPSQVLDTSDQDLTESSRRRLDLVGFEGDREEISSMIGTMSKMEPGEVSAFCLVLKEHREAFIDQTQLQLDSQPADPEWLRLTGMMSSFDDDSKSSIDVQRIVRLLTDEHVDQVPGWAELFSEIREQLHEPLVTYPVAESLPIINQLLCCFFEDKPDRLLPLLRRVPLEDLPIPWTDFKKEGNAGKRSAYAIELGKRAAQLADQCTTSDEAHQLEAANVSMALLKVDVGSTDAWLNVEDTQKHAYVYFAHRWYEAGIPPECIVDRLLQSNDPDAQYALVLAISQCFRGNVPSTSSKQLEAWLAKTYAKSPDAGVHSIVGWLLRKYGMANLVRSIDDQTERGIVPGRNWYINSLGVHMSIITPSADTTQDTTAESDLPQQEKRTKKPSRRFAIAQTESTCAEFFNIVYESLLFPPFQLFQPLEQRPSQHGSKHGNFADLLQYCNAASSHENLDLACNLNNKSKAWAIDFREPGYRPPTSEEWEYACRAGTQTSLFFGNDETPFLDTFVSCKETKTDRQTKVGTKAPNRWGLFDCYGNASEWVATITEHKKNGNWQKRDEQDTLTINPTTYACYRGGAFASQRFEFHSSRIDIGQAARMPGVGSRLARTLE